MPEKATRKIDRHEAESRGADRREAGTENKNIKFDKNIVIRLFSYTTRHWYMFAAALIMILIVSWTQVQRPFLVKTAINDFIVKGADGEIPVGEALRQVRNLGLSFLLLVIIEFVFSYGHTYVLHLAGMRVIMEIRDKVFSKIQRLPVQFFDKMAVGRLVTRVTNDTDALNQMYSDITVGLFRDIITMVWIVIMMFSMDVTLTFISFLLLPVIAIVTVLFRKKAREVFSDIRNKLAIINAFLSEHITAMKIIQVFNMEKRKAEDYDKANFEHYKATMGRVKIFGLFRPLLDVIRSLALALMIWYGGGQILQGRLEFGTLYAFINYINMFFQPIMHLAEQYNTFQAGLVSSDRIFTLLDTPSEPEPELPVEVERVKGEIEFRNVWFAYVGEEWVLKDVSFKINPGESVAFVGATGAGKTSIINLICGFYEIQKGQILIDGVDIREIDKNSLRRNIGLVLQDVFLFSGDIMTNIRLFDNFASDGKAIDASKHVYADTFISKLPKQYNNPVNERGTTLSMGQRQLISFARALLRDPAILVLDEATSSIDTETEALIQDALKRIMEGRTSIAIAHRLSTIQNVDRIIVLHKGRIREMGNHQELLDKKGLYYDLYRLQYANADHVLPAS